MVQSIVIINFKEKISEEKRQEIISNIYSNNEKDIIGMSNYELKEGLDYSKEIKDIISNKKQKNKNLNDY